MKDIKKIDIKKTDLISGECYINFIKKYKEYDRKQKEHINKLSKQVEALNAIINSTKFKSRRNLIDSYNSCKKSNKELQVCIAKLKKENSEKANTIIELKNKIILLQNELHNSHES